MSKYGKASPNAWISLVFDSWALAIESSAVIGLRLARIGSGDGTIEETGLMIGEKIEAAVRLHLLAVTGALGSTPPAAAARTLRHYRKVVKANRRRLSRQRGF